MRTDRKRLAGKRIAILAGDGFEYIELAAPRAALRAAGAEVEIVSLHDGRVRGMNLTEPTKTVAVDQRVDEVDVHRYDGLLIVGGFVGPDFVRQSEAARAFVRSFDRESKPIATLCHGPWVLVSAGLVSGRRLASWPSVRDDIVHAGGVWRDASLVRDRNWVSSRGPQDLAAFIPAIVELFASGADAPARGALAGADTASESSPQPREPLAPAVAAARLMPKPSTAVFAGAAMAVAAAALAARRVLS